MKEETKKQGGRWKKDGEKNRPPRDQGKRFSAGAGHTQRTGRQNQAKPEPEGMASRRIALRVIRQVTEQGAYASLCLDKALEKIVVKGSTVRIDGGNCYIRTVPNTDGKILGVAYRGDVLPHGGETSETGWLRVKWREQDAWVSGKYGKVE